MLRTNSDSGRCRAVRTPAAAPAAAVPATVRPTGHSSSPRPVEPQAPAPAASRYSGEPISVNLKDVDLRDFFRLIHEISGLNVVVDPAVKGTLTIVLDDVPWDQALDIVLHNNDLDKQLDGNVLRIATKETLKKEAEETRDLAKAQAEAADVVTTTRVLSYAKATDMAATLKKFLSSRGDILADDRSNTLIIRDVPSMFPVIDNLLRQLDRKSQQVEIEARVVAANRSFDREFGSMLGASGESGQQRPGWYSGRRYRPDDEFTPTPPALRRIRLVAARAVLAGSFRCLRTLEPAFRPVVCNTLIRIGQFRARPRARRPGGEGCRQAALEAEGDHAEQPEGDRSSRELRFPCRRSSTIRFRYSSSMRSSNST